MNRATRRIFIASTTNLLLAPLIALHAADLDALFQETPEQHDARMQWWREARFGMFVHWGLFSAAGGTWNGKPCPFLGCWMQDSFKIPAKEYRSAFMPKFTGEHFDPDFIAQLAQDTGMKYIVPITKHHEGFCLFDSKFTDFKISNTPAKRDWIKELAEASRMRGLKVGFYYSQNLDWHHPGGGGGEWDPTHKGDPDKYVDELVIPQLCELLSSYGDVSILWFDIPGGVIDEARAHRILKVVHQLQPNIVINNRLGGGFHGDLETPEQSIPSTGFPGRDWETCQTINGTWEYTHYDRNWKSPTTLVRELIDTASKGGNYLLNIGPKPDGTVPQSTIDTLHAIGNWMKVHGDAIYGTSASPFSKQLPWGRCTQKQLGNGVTRLYLHLFKWPFDSVLRVPALENEIAGASLLSEPGAGPLKFSRDVNQDTLVQLPIAEPNDYATVVMLDLKGAPKVIPRPIGANAEGVMILEAESADIHGATLRYQPEQQSLGYWIDANDYASWQVRFAKPGRYHVDVTYGCKSGMGGGDYTIQVAGKQIMGTASDTKDWFDRRTDRIGIIEVETTQDAQVAVRIRKKVGVAVFDFQS
ncbi:MAG: alpha-L-fucosidase, partial [Pirellulales bacterium]|nr:alpha-L-fucosidase [Pirellulales bacterium]